MRAARRSTASRPVQFTPISGVGDRISEIAEPIWLGGRYTKELSRALDWLDVVHAAAIPMRAKPRTARCGEVLEQAGHRISGPVCREQLGTLVGCFPFAFATGDKNGRARFVGKPVERVLGRVVAAPLS